MVIRMRDAGLKETALQRSHSSYQIPSCAPADVLESDFALNFLKPESSY
jgi:hypothetical protein